jgi:hypothetical protein
LNNDFKKGKKRGKKKGAIPAFYPLLSFCLICLCIIEFAMKSSEGTYRHQRKEKKIKLRKHSMKIEITWKRTVIT